MEDDREPIRRIELKLLEAKMKTLEANIGAALERLRADMAKRDEEFAKSQNARDWRMIGTIIGSFGLAVVILGLLIRLPVSA